jgi:hypothetical protein
MQQQQTTPSLNNHTSMPVDSNINRSQIIQTIEHNEDKALQSTTIQTAKRLIKPANNNKKKTNLQLGIGSLGVVLWLEIVAHIALKWMENCSQLCRQWLRIAFARQLLDTLLDGLRLQSEPITPITHTNVRTADRKNLPRLALLARGLQLELTTQRHSYVFRLWFSLFCFGVGRRRRARQQPPHTPINNDT